MTKALLNFGICLSLLNLTSSAQTADTNPPPILHINAGQVTAQVVPMFSGMMTEEINHSYDGGLYGELIQNRAFKDDTSSPVHWSVVREGGAAAIERGEWMQKCRGA